jgi:hypothetical protein
MYSSSFKQTNKFQDKSNRFVHVTPSDVEAQLNKQGFKLISLKTGSAKTVERADHQTTFARYRHIDLLSNDGGGLQYDIVAKIPHLYGSMEFMAGVYRLICTNGLVAGTTFEAHKVPHVGDALRIVAESVESLVANRPKLLHTFEQWAQVQLTGEQMVALAVEGLKLRAPDVTNAPEVSIRNILQPWRSADDSYDLWSVFNVVQENLTKRSFKYSRVNEVTKELEVTSTRRLLRPNSQVNVDFNRRLYDIASQFAVAS